LGNEKMKNLIRAKKIAESNRNSISDWLKKAVEVRKFEPFVRQAHDMLSWQCESFNKIPDNAPDIKPEAVESLYFSGEVFLKRLPQITTQTDNDFSIAAVPATTIPGSSMTFEYLNDIYSQISPEDQKIILPQINSYKSLQEIQKRYESLKEKLGKLNPDVEKELETASRELQHYKNSTAGVFSPASAIRNVLQHFKGELLFKARKTEKETPNWDIMAERFVLETSLSPEYNILKNERYKHTGLYDKLSRILKGNKFVTPDELENLFIEVIDHMHTVLSLIKIKEYLPNQANSRAEINPNRWDKTKSL
jgi:hypothetical protein